MQNIRNIAIIAHVDHGKTTLVDKMLHQAKLFRENQEQHDLILDNNDLERERGITILAKNVSIRYKDTKINIIDKMLHQAKLFRDNQEQHDLILDNNDLERERGITILAKNVSIRYKDTKINIIDTPGHADFGGEVERVLNMADGVLLLVDAFEGPMPQTRFVLQKALHLGLKPIVVINKVDKPNCRPDEVHDHVFELFFNLEATEEQLDFPTFYGSSKQGWMSTDYKTPTQDISALLDGIVQYIPPAPSHEGTPQLQITSIDFSSYTGRIAVGRLFRGTLTENMPVSLVKRDGSIQKSRIKELYAFEGLGKVKVKEVKAGEICAVFGIEDFEIGDTIADLENPEGLKPIDIDEPTMNMLFTINNSPFFGKEGKFVTSRQIRDRLYKEVEKNLAMRIQDTGSADQFLVFGRGILHLSILIETMRREGYELQVGQPKVLVKEIDGQKHEPVEVLMVDVPEETAGKVIELVSQRKGEMLIMEPKGDLQHLEFSIPSRGLSGLRNAVLTATAGEAIMAHRFKAYEPWKGNIPGRINGVLVSKDKGMATAYSLDKLQDRGFFFIEPGEEIYNGQIIGENNRMDDLTINVIQGKKLTNMRASGTDDNAKIAPPRKFSLEEALEYIQEDEYVEVTPQSIRMRKILLDENDRAKRKKQMVAEY